jgi:RNA polymerase sigma-70 factor (ECF subfamily)
MSSTLRITRLLRLMDEASGANRDRRFNEAVEVLYDVLKRAARNQMRRERSDSLSATVLVSEAYIRMLATKRMRFDDTQHFVAMFALRIRQVATDLARRRRGRKRGGGFEPVTLRETTAAAANPDLVTILDVERAMDVLTQAEATVVDLKFFGGLTIEAIAEATDSSQDTVKKRWRQARAKLRVALNSESNGGADASATA